MNNKGNILVSVCMITYNHADFIAEAIDNIITQQTTFRFELVIGEDCSTDNTREICLEYQKKYPELIRLLLPEKNGGMMNNLINTIRNCQGKYIALCEGDDYWIDPLKLQKQVDFMEVHPDFSLCSHVSDIFDYTYMQKGKIPTQTELTTEDLIRQRLGIMTASILFRSDALHMPEWFSKVKNGDYALILLVSLKGRIKILPDTMSVYRRNVGAISSIFKPFFTTSWMVYLLNQFNNYTEKKYNRLIREKIKDVYKIGIGMAKSVKQRRDLLKLLFFRSLYLFSPFLIKDFRN